VVRFIEDNWLGGQRIGGGSFDASAGSIMNMFNFSGSGNAPTVYLDQNLGTRLSSAPAI
jgi:phospholipase C